MEATLLNADLLERALLFLDFQELEMAAAPVSRLWRDVARGQGIQPVFHHAFGQHFATQDENTLGEMEPASCPAVFGAPFDWRAECRYRRAACFEGWSTAPRRKGAYVCGWMIMVVNR